MSMCLKNIYPSQHQLAVLGSQVDSLFLNFFFNASDVGERTKFTSSEYLQLSGSLSFLLCKSYPESVRAAKIKLKLETDA